MNGLLNHLSLTLRLNFRSWQAVVYGYLVPLFFLIAFGAIFRASTPALSKEMGQLLTVTVLGGACFGMPTAMVAERERGVWRRYRLLPSATAGIILSTMVARFVLVLSAAVLQVVLARIIFGTTFPQHPLELLAAFAFVCFAFLGIGLVIAMLAGNVPAVQALGQAIFLPVIIIGGVGVPLGQLPKWAKHVAAFLPGRYAVEAMQRCVIGKGLGEVAFDLLALGVIGLAACVVGAKLFRWDVAQRISPPARAWVFVALLAWAGVGLATERTGRLSLIDSDSNNSALFAAIAGHPSTTTSRPSPTPTTNGSTASPPTITQAEPWDSVTDADIKGITYEDVPDDTGTVAPIVANLDDLDDDTRKKLQDVADKLNDWEPGKVKDLGQRVRNYISLCGMVDFVQDPMESYIPYVVFEKLKGDVPKDQLTKIVAWIVLNPDAGTVVIDAKDLGFEIGTYEQPVRERTTMYAKKLLWRLLGKGKPGEPTNEQK